MNHALAAERRRRAALLPPGSACGDCGTTDTLLLDANLAPIRCADDAASAAGKKLVERHHLGKRLWNVVVDLTPNWHRILSALQRMRKDPTAGKFAELLHGIADLIHALADQLARYEEESPE